jgi:hypothetical protein
MVSTTLKVVNNWQIIKEEKIDDNFLIHNKKNKKSGTKDPFSLTVEKH